MQIISRQDAISQGLKRYFTGKPCKNGHTDERHTRDSMCRTCDRDLHKKWKLSNPDKIRADWQSDNAKARARRYYKENAERLKAASAARRQADPDYMKRWHKANPASQEEKKAYNQKRIAEYPEKAPEIRAKVKMWAKANPERVRENAKIGSHVRRARKNASKGRFTKDDVASLLKVQKSKCPVCRSSLKAGYHIDHIMPLKLGGSNESSNIQLLCAPCNLSKNARHPVDFMRSRGFLL